MLQNMYGAHIAVGFRGIQCAGCQVKGSSRHRSSLTARWRQLGTLTSRDALDTWEHPNSCCIAAATAGCLL